MGKKKARTNFKPAIDSSMLKTLRSVGSVLRTLKMPKTATSSTTNGTKRPSSSDTKNGSSSSSPPKKSKKSPPSEFKKGTWVGKDGKYDYDGTVLTSDEDVRTRDGYTEPIPKRDSKTNVLLFPDAKDFRPNMTPKEVLQKGSFGGTYYRPIKSSVTGLKYNKVWLELPQNWLEGLEVRKKISSSVYDEGVNTYKAKCGGSLDMWETSGWIKECDPYGWFMWYTRFYLGRRTDDDERQIGRWKSLTGDKGRFKNNLIGKIARAGVKFDNKAVSPVIRQTLQHWGYTLTEKDYLKRLPQVKM